MILTEKQQKYQHYPQVTDKYQYLTSKVILPSDQSRITEQAKFTCSSLNKAFDKEIKTIEKQGKIQVEALEVLKQEKIRNQKQLKNFFQKRQKIMKLKMN